MNGSKTRLGSVVVAVPAVAIAISAFAGPAMARSIPVNLRVVSKAGKTLVNVRQYTDATRIPTHPSAKCFFGGTGGSGKAVKVARPSPAGALVDGARLLRRLRPLSITDEFVNDGFGVGICGIGGAVVAPSASDFWNVRVNHAGISVGSNLYRSRRGDEVLFALASCDSSPPFACPDELIVQAPARTRPGVAFEVQVWQYSDTGVRAPAVGATVTGGAPTDASGLTLVTLGKSTRVVARKAGDISSQPATVCVAKKLSDCTAVRGAVITGTPGVDGIRGTNGDDLIKPGGGGDHVRARGGRDVIDVRGGGLDGVRCGAGVDLVKADAADRVAGDCEVVERS